MPNDFIIPKNIERYISQLIIGYKNQTPELFHILKESEAKINDQDYIYDDYDRAYGHNLRVFLPPEYFENHPSLEKQSEFAEKVKDDLNRTIFVPGEYINKVIFELKDGIDLSSYLKNKIAINPEKLDFWDKDCLRVFISYDGKNREIAKKLKKHLLDSGISCFVANEDTQGKKYTEEIKKALKSMELMIALVSKNFNESCWANQEIGFAVCRNIDIISIELDQTKPEGFITGITKMELNEQDRFPSPTNYLKLINFIRNKFPKHPFIKTNLLKKFFDARSTHCQQARITFMDIINLKFNNTEIEKIVKEITDTREKYPGNYGGTNQLSTLLIDGIGSDHLIQLPEEQRGQYKYYAELLESKVLSQHTKKRYSITKPNGRNHCEIIDNQIINNQKPNDEQSFDEIPF